MKLIVVHRAAASRTIELGKWSWAILSACCVGIPLGLMAAGYELGERQGAANAQLARIDGAEAVASERAEALAQLGADASQQLRAMSQTVADLQARVTRLDALGIHLTELTGLDDGEFNFDVLPPMGGPAPQASDLLPELEPKQMARELTALEQTLVDREGQLDILAELVAGQRVRAEAVPSGRPVLKGWLSSGYGERSDPFSGDRAWHEGVDFAGREGEEIIAVASGVVSFSGERSGYGTMVEVAHGDGLVTRYAHNEENLVAVGDLVRKGEAIALMGNSGRSTGPHVHFEVYKHGRPVDPASYVRRTQR